MIGDHAGDHPKRPLRDQIGDQLEMWSLTSGDHDRDHPGPPPQGSGTTVPPFRGDQVPPPSGHDLLLDLLDRAIDDSRIPLSPVHRVILRQRLLDVAEAEGVEIRRTRGAAR